MVAQSGNRRLVRVAESIRFELARALVKAVADPRLAWVTVTDVEVSPDLRHARVFYVVTSGGDDGPAERERTARSLAKAAPFLQGELGRNLNLRYTPRLNFALDKSFDQAAKIDALLDEVETDEAAAPSTAEQQLARLVSESEQILVVAHRNPDGDAVGSLLGFSRMLRLMGKAPVVYCPDGVPGTLSFLEGADSVADALSPDAVFELTVSLDTADSDLWPPGMPDRARMGTLVVIDHHEKHKPFGDVVVRWQASAVGEMLLSLQKRLVWPIDAAVAECLYTSIVADTGSFRYANTTPETHQAAAELIGLGARSWVVATALFESYPVARQRLLAAVLNTLTLSYDERYAAMYCTPAMLEEAGAGREDLDNVINFGRGIDSVLIAAMFRQEPDGNIKVSFRSKGDWDVADIAQRFGGGGHRNAAGCTLTGTTLEEALRQVDSVVAGVITGSIQ